MLGRCLGLAGDTTALEMKDENNMTMSAFKHGDLIGGLYSVIACLGVGATGIVYKVRHERTGQIMALKIPSPELLSNAITRKNFLREYQVTKSLRHPHLVQVFDVVFNEIDDQVFFTMELMEGGDLGDLLEQAVHAKKALPYDRVIRWMGQVAEALAYLHREGWVHQDIKPANIILDQLDQVKLGDFGLAFMPLGETMKARFTKTSVIGGTTYFMSPEQHRAIFYRKREPITTASDVCAFGLTLYNLLSGEVIVGQREFMEEFVKDPDLAQELNVFLDRCLARKPERRFPNGEDLLIDFRRIIAMLRTSPDAQTPEAFLKKLRKKVFSQQKEPGERRCFPLPGGSELCMVWIPPCRFRMGSHPGEEGRAEPSFEAIISQGFWMGEAPITQAQWLAVSRANPSFFSGKNHPVEMVSFLDCQEFIEKLNQHEGRSCYRLPTEAEWEYACRAGTHTAYAGDLNKMAWYKDNSRETTHKVGTKKANAWGLYDMHGNVWEWCLDWYDEYPVQRTTDPKGAHTGSHRVIRGGSWDYGAEHCRSANRYRYSPENKNINIGLRLIRMEEE